MSYPRFAMFLWLTQSPGGFLTMYRSLCALCHLLGKHRQVQLTTLARRLLNPVYKRRQELLWPILLASRSYSNEISVRSELSLFRRLRLIIFLQFTAMYKRRAFLHWYIGEGMDEQEVGNEFAFIASEIIVVTFTTVRGG